MTCIQTERAASPVKNPFEQYPEIKFADVRKGDTIARVERADGILDVTVGVAVERDDDTWYTEGGGYALAYDYKTSQTHDNFYLIDRPKQELPKEPGKVIKITKYNGEPVEPPVLAMRVHTNHYNSIDPENFMACLPIGNKCWLTDELVEDFELMDLTPAQ